MGPAAGVVRRRLGGGVGGRAAARRVARAVAADVFDAAAAAAPVGAAGLGARAVAVEGVFVDDEHRVAGIRGDELEGHFWGRAPFQWTFLVVLVEMMTDLAPFVFSSCKQESILRMGLLLLVFNNM